MHEQLVDWTIWLVLNFPGFFTCLYGERKSAEVSKLNIFSVNRVVLTLYYSLMTPEMDHN